MFVCTGNICRSPMAERFAIAYSAQLKLANFSASSAGIRAVVGHAIHPSAALVLESLGGDASSFAARQFIPTMAADADLILTMTTAHRDAVLELAPRALHRTFVLAEAARLASEGGAATVADLSHLRAQFPSDSIAQISDPIGQSIEVFETVGAQIADLLQPLIGLCSRSAMPKES
ncbi:low molecular weight phosphatase family protein [Mycolicibacterium chubuense]|uniref:arsenate reductase/protein-tyrosine-phosphatase family protein n=1 Tax=Mycolicibacterium chubuense TaxID=1800 RepID=UPI0031B5B740